MKIPAKWRGELAWQSPAGSGAWARVRRQERLCVHRVEIVDAVEERGLDTARTERAGDHVEDDGAAEAADVDGPGRRLRVVDDLRAIHARCELIRPVHVFAPLPASCRAASPGDPWWRRPLGGPGS